MTRSFKALILAGVATIGLGLMPAIAAADDGRRGHGDGGRGQVQWSRGHDHDRGAGRRYVKYEPRKVAAWHGHGHSYKYKAPKHGYAAPRYSRGHDDHDLLPFLVIGAIGVGAAILASQSHAEPPRAQTVAYVPPPPPAYRPAPGYNWEPAPQGAAATCLMTREYQTQITVGGRLVDAYGQACLQPDGAWLKGPAQPVPY